MAMLEPNLCKANPLSLGFDHHILCQPQVLVPILV